MDTTATETPSVSDFFAAFGVTDPAAAVTPPVETTPPEETPAKPTETAPVTPGTTPENTEPEQPATAAALSTPAAQPDKAAHAFAEMRTRNAQYEKTIKGVAQILGIPDKDPDAVITALTQKMTEAQAKQQNVPVELLTRLQQLEQQTQQQQQETIQRNAFLGFQKLKDTFTLDETALTNFAAELGAVGINPFEHEVDLVNEYKVRKFDELMSQAEERGKQAEIARSTNAQNHSASINTNDGTPPADPEKINTVAQLNNWLNNQSH